MTIKFLSSLFLSAVFMTLFLTQPASAVRIPLDKASESQTATKTLTMGYVDIERVFQEHPMTKRMKEDFLSQAESRRKNIADIQNSITTMKSVIISSSALVSKLKDDIEQQKNIALSRAQVMAVSTYTVTASTTMIMQLPGITPKISSGTAQTVLTSTSALSAFEGLTTDEKQKIAKDMEEGITKIKQDIDTRTNELCKFVDLKKKELDKIEADNTDSVMRDIYQVLDSIAKEEDIAIVVDKSQILYGQSVKDLTDKVLDRLRGR